MQSESTILAEREATNLVDLSVPVARPVEAPLAEGIKQRIQHTHQLAIRAAARLVANLPKDWKRPENPIELIETVERMMKTPRKFGVFLTKPEIRSLRRMHALYHFQNVRPTETVDEPNDPVGAVRSEP